ncbi:hypothetical protein K9M78_07435 [Candidatus Bipolaricaulota bacterium]|nr:hypothetical protein [Candidatus Bipolaricaulota bacterium]
MKVLDLEELEPEEGAEVFYEAEEFSGRVIELPTGGSMPPCEMDSYVIFYVIAGEATVSVDEEETGLSRGRCMITEPATLSLETEEGVRILGVQVAKG